MKTRTGVFVILLALGGANSAFAKTEQKKPTVEDWIGGKLTDIATVCVGTDNIKKLQKKVSLLPQSLTKWSTFSSNLTASRDKVRAGSAGKFMGQIIDISGATPVVLANSLSGTAYPPRAVAQDGYGVTHVQNCMTMLAGKGNLKLAAVILQAALDATYNGSNTKALVLEGGTMTSAYAWALDDGSTAKFPGIDRTEVMLDMWAWYRSNPIYAESDKLQFYDTMSAIEAHLVNDISVEYLLKGSVNATGGLPFLTGGADGNGTAKVMTNSKADGFETAIFSSHERSMPKASALAARLEPRLHLVMDQANQVWFAGSQVKLTARLGPAPESACMTGWVAENGTLASPTWDAETRACRFDVTFTPARTTGDAVTLPFYLKSTVGNAVGASIRVGQNVVLSNEAAKISFAGVTPSLGALPALSSVAPMPLTLSYRVAERQGRVLDSVAANDQLTFKCGTDTDTTVMIKDAHVASGVGTKDVMVSADIPASALKNVGQTPVRCTVGGTITAKSTGTGGVLSQDKALPTSSFDLVRPSAVVAPPQPATPAPAA